MAALRLEASYSVNYKRKYGYENDAQIIFSGFAVAKYCLGRCQHKKLLVDEMQRRLSVKKYGIQTQLPVGSLAGGGS